MHQEKVEFSYFFATLASISVVAAESITKSLETVRDGGNRR